MANPEHVAVVRKGKDAIAGWRRANPGVHFDLREADLMALDLSEANLCRADLRSAILLGAHLNMANLSDGDLAGAHVLGADLRRADLSGTDLTQLNGGMTNFSWAKLAGANLGRATLPLCNFFEADLRGANCTGAYLGGCNLNASQLHGANLSRVWLSATSLGRLDLSQASGLAEANHGAPSSVGVDTLLASFRGAGNNLTPDLQAFFRGAGVPSELLDALPAIVAEVKYYSCFISYGQPDVAFATKLRGDLVAKGVSCWLYEMDRTVGEPTWREIEQKLEEYDRMVVVCSIDALMRDGVKKEIDKQIDKSQDKLVPVSLDDRWTQPGFAAQWAGRDLKAFLSERNRADFPRWESDPQQYQKALDDLLKGLKRECG
jgi:uncharacterized protein YjbI with pentapeptide repeats